MSEEFKFTLARIEMLSETVVKLQKENKELKKRLSLATNLIKFAKNSPCGSNGEFDRFFE